MKNKITAALISTAMAITSSASLFPFLTFAESQELFNDTFESSYNGWGARGDATLEIVSTTAHSGSKSLYITGRTTAWHGAGCAKIKELRAGNTYDLSSWVMFDTGNDWEQINFSILYTDGNGTENYKQISNVNAQKGVWTEIKGSYSIPADATNITLYFETPSNLIDFYIDDISAVGELSADSDVEGFADDFNTGTMQWNGRGNAKCSIATGQGLGGSDCLYTEGRTALWNGPSSNKTLVLNAGNYYRFAGWVKYTDTKYTDTQGFSMNLQYQQNGVEQYYEIARTTAVIGEWAYIEGEYTLPADAANFSVYFQTTWKPDANVTEQDLMNFYIDDVSATKLPPPSIQEELVNLQDVYADYFKLGCAASATELATPATQDLIKKHYNSFTLGNELKPDACLDQNATLKYMQSTGDDTNPQISLANAKAQLDFAAENNIPVRGHVLVWHSQTPDWFFKENYDANGAWVSKDTMLKRLENYIKNIMETLATDYPDVEFYAWDVVNEAFSETGTMREAGSNNVVNGQSAWMQVFGDDSFIDYAFEYARKYAPENCSLFYNDYNEYIPAKRDAIYEKCKELAEKGLIDGIGMQSHIKMGSPSIELYEEAIRKYDSLGLEVQITELDIDQKSNSEEDLLELAQRYQDVFKLYKDLVDDGVNLTAVVIWGITDNTSWIGGYPLLFDKNYQAKEAFYAVADTDYEVDKISVANAIPFDNTTVTMEKAFEMQSPNVIDGKGEFKLAVNSNNHVLHAEITAYKEMDVSYYFEGTVNRGVTGKGGIETIHLKAGETKVIGVQLEPVDGGPEIAVNLDIDFGGTTWNGSVFGEDGIPTGTLGRVKFFDETPKYAEAVYGTPVIDGTIDSIWTNANTIDVDVYTLGNNGATATSKMLWDENYIYVLTEVKDSVLSSTNANAHEQDTVEVFFDENNKKTSVYESDDIQARINYENLKTVTDGRSIDDFESSVSIIDGGYLVEVAIPSTLGGLKNNQIVGFDVQINDDDGSGSRTGIANWNDTTGLGYMNTSNFGVLKLVGGQDSILWGDANCDKKVSVADVVAAAAVASDPDSFSLTAQGAINADVHNNGDGVSALDASVIQEISIGLYDGKKLPIS